MNDRHHLDRQPAMHDALHALTAWIEAMEAGVSVCALIDMAAMQQDHDVAKALRQIREAGAVSVLGDPRPEAELASPWLLPLACAPDVNHRLLNMGMAWAWRGPCVTWVSSHLQTQELATRLRQRTQAMLPQNQPVLLRCYDPRVLPELHKALRPDQADAYWALGHAWAYLDRAQQLQTIALRPAPDTDSFGAPLTLDQDQFTALLDASEIDSVMPELAKEAPDAFMALPTTQRAAFTQRCLKLADAWYVQASGQRVMVGVLALRLGENFHQDAAWAPWIDQLKQGKMDLIQVIEKAAATSAGQAA